MSTNIVHAAYPFYFGSRAELKYVVLIYFVNYVPFMILKINVHFDVKH